MERRIENNGFNVECDLTGLGEIKENTRYVRRAFKKMFGDSNKRACRQNVDQLQKSHRTM